jgi:hypothetical protein
VDNIKARNANPLIASTFISIQIKALAAKGAKKLLLNIIFILILILIIKKSLYSLIKDLKLKVLAKRKLYLKKRNLFSIN